MFCFAALLPERFYYIKSISTPQYLFQFEVTCKGKVSVEVPHFGKNFVWKELIVCVDEKLWVKKKK